MSNKTHYELPDGTTTRSVTDVLSGVSDTMAKTESTVAALIRALEEAHEIIDATSQFVPTPFDGQMLRWERETSALLAALKGEK